jgi:hypothetical protein
MNVQSDPESSFSLADGSITPNCITLDPDGNLWIGGGATSFVKVAAADIAATGPTDGGTIGLTPIVKIRTPVSNPTAQFCAMAAH